MSEPTTPITDEYDGQGDHDLLAGGVHDLAAEAAALAAGWRGC